MRIPGFRPLPQAEQRARFVASVKADHVRRVARDRDLTGDEHHLLRWEGQVEAERV